MALADVVPGDALAGARFLRLIADETRWLIVRILALSDLRAGEIGAALRLPANALSYHLKRLRSAGVVRDRHSSADARDVYYHLDVDRLGTLYAAAGQSLYPGLLAFSGDALSDDSADVPEASGVRTGTGTAQAQPLRVLFLCTHNSARSQIAEALLRQMGGTHVEVYSAGSVPTLVDPEAIATLQAMGIATSGLYAKSLDQFVGDSFDYIITVCDRVRDICPAFPSDPVQAHWSIADPAIVEDPGQRTKAFHQVAVELQTRIRYLLLLPHPATGERSTVDR
jgi:ArsR family transcriptional regulator, arsenate/arsenite/antimonite-responsive transcriptional repressor / arsenate reductase (thioredoxin)